MAITGLGNNCLELGGFAGKNTVVGVFDFVSMGTALVVLVGAGETGLMFRLVFEGMEGTGNDGSGAALAMGLATGDREAVRSSKPLTFVRLT